VPYVLRSAPIINMLFKAQSDTVDTVLTTMKDANPHIRYERLKVYLDEELQELDKAKNIRKLEQAAQIWIANQNEKINIIIENLNAAKPVSEIEQLVIMLEKEKGHEQNNFNGWYFRPNISIKGLPPQEDMEKKKAAIERAMLKKNPSLDGGLGESNSYILTVSDLVKKEEFLSNLPKYRNIRTLKIGGLDIDDNFIERLSQNHAFARLANIDLSHNPKITEKSLKAILESDILGSI